MGTAIVGLGAALPAAAGPPASAEAALTEASREELRTRLAELLEYRADEWMFEQVNFWVRTFAHYGTRQGLIHDSKHVQVVFEIVDFKKLGPSESRKLIRERKDYWKSVLLAVHRKRKTPHKMTPNELHVYRMYSDVDEAAKFIEAASDRRIRFQRGQKDRFAEAIRRSGRYLPMMERVFREEGLPVELTRLPFVESSFNVRAYSKVGAAGLWQFMPSTGKMFLRIDEAVDERLDPYHSTRAAARFLKANHEALGSWPLAVMAYNHGRSGIGKAKELLGSMDVKRIMENYRSRTFRFASRNFFPEFLAAYEVEKNAALYFGEIERDPPDRRPVVAVADYVRLPDLARYLELDSEILKELNPAYRPKLLKGKVRLPAGATVRLPEGWGKDDGGAREAFWRRYSRIPSAYKHRRQVSGICVKEPRIQLALNRR